MKNVFLVLLLVFGTLAGAQSVESTPYIEVVGQAERFITPDQIFIRIQLASEKVSSFENLEDKTMKALSSLGLTSKDITLADSHGEELSFWYKKGYETSKTLLVEVATAQMVNDVTMALHKIGVKHVAIAKVDYSKKEELLNELRVIAMKEAKQRATLMLEAVDAGVGKPIMVRETPWNSGPIRQNMMLRESAMMTSAKIEKSEISFKKLKYRSQVTVRFAID